MTEPMFPNATNLSDVIEPTTAGALPSSRTEGMLAQALESDNIDFVKGQLMHAWAHYQSLEFLLNNRAAVSQTLAVAKAELVNDVDDADLAIGFYATGAIEVAYDTAHNVSNVMAAGLADTVPDALRFLYPTLDHSDPERELSLDDLDRLLKGE